MNWNKIGKNGRKTAWGLSSKVFGIMKTPRSQHLKTSKNGELDGSVYRIEQREKILREFEVKRSQALEFVRRFQNC
jgi:hypothetical protein